MGVKISNATGPTNRSQGVLLLQQLHVSKDCFSSNFFTAVSFGGLIEVASLGSLNVNEKKKS